MSEYSGRRATPGRLVAITATLLVLLSPFLWLLQMSFKSNDQILQFPPPLIFTPTLENYVSLWHSAFSASFLVRKPVFVTCFRLPSAFGVASNT